LQKLLLNSTPRPKYNQEFVDAAYASYYQYADNLSPEDLNSIKQSSLAMFLQEIEYIIRYDKKRSAILDIGSGMGTFLLAAKPYYQKLTGLDVSQQMASFVKKQLGIEVEVAQYENYNPGHKFSLIHMSHVLEHVPDPNRWIQHSRELLDEGGVLVINVPHKMGLSHRLQHMLYKLKLKKQISSSWADPARTPDHLFEPTIDSMKYLLEKNNFEILEYYTYSRKEPTSKKGKYRIMNRWLNLGSNLTLITRPK
jgi:2-polyprenyl-3-methyl-5-hydroxy-6-metoxy-1,4-benzoquinol methylase